MTSNRDAIVREAIRHALEFRKQKQLTRFDGANPFDLALSAGATIRIQDLKSLEGAFISNPSPTILLPTTQHRHGDEFFSAVLTNLGTIFCDMEIRLMK